MSMSSSVFRQKQSDFSADIEDLKQQNRLLVQQNLTLKKSLEELININTELTESIEQFNNSHSENFPHINQQEIEQLAHQVIELQQELERERNQKHRERSAAAFNNNNDNTGAVEETLKVIEELVNSFRSMQEEYQAQIERIERQLMMQKDDWQNMAADVQQKLMRFQNQYGKVLFELRKTENVINSLDKELQQKSTKAYLSKKQMKISTTIQDLKQTLDKQIEDKNRIIKVYENLIDSIRGRLSEKISI